MGILSLLHWCYLLRVPCPVLPSKPNHFCRVGVGGEQGDSVVQHLPGPASSCAPSQAGSGDYCSGAVPDRRLSSARAPLGPPVLYPPNKPWDCNCLTPTAMPYLACGHGQQSQGFPAALFQPTLTSKGPHGWQNTPFGPHSSLAKTLGLYHSPVQEVLLTHSKHGLWPPRSLWPPLPGR